MPQTLQKILHSKWFVVACVLACVAYGVWMSIPIIAAYRPAGPKPDLPPAFAKGRNIWHQSISGKRTDYYDLTGAFDRIESEVSAWFQASPGWTRSMAGERVVWTHLSSDRKRFAIVSLRPGRWNLTHHVRSVFGEARSYHAVIAEDSTAAFVHYGWVDEGILSRLDRERLNAGTPPAGR